MSQSFQKSNCPEPTGYVCSKGSCAETCDPNPTYKTFQDCTSHCKTSRRQTLWIVLGVLGAVILGVLIWVAVVRVRHRHRYTVGKVVNEMRLQNGAAQTSVPPTIPSSQPQGQAQRDGSLVP